MDSDIKWRVFCRDLTVKCARKSVRLSNFGTTLLAFLKPYRQALQTSNLLFYPKLQHRDYKFFTLLSSGILFINNRKLLARSSLVVSLKEKWLLK